MKKNGFTLFELMIGLGLMGILGLWAKDGVLSVLRLQNVIRDRNQWQVLEQNLRNALLDETSFKNNIKRSKLLQQCLSLDKIDCPSGLQPISLFSLQGEEVTGGFLGEGKNCSGQACPIQIEGTFRGICESGAICDSVASLAIDYRILVNGMVYRQGFLQRLNVSKPVSDQNIACATDSQGRTGFAHQVSANTLLCGPPPPSGGKLEGVKAGSCALGKELMVGFKENGEIICEEINKEEGKAKP